MSSAQLSTNLLASGVRSICLAIFLTCLRTEQTSGLAERSPVDKESADMAKERVRRGNSGSVRSICLAIFLTCLRTEQTSGLAERSPVDKESADMAKERVRRGSSGSTIGHI